MKSLHIRDIDPAVLDALKRLASRHHRSLQGELRAILEREARLAGAQTAEPLKLHTVKTGRSDIWSRDEIYDDQGR